MPEHRILVVEDEEGIALHIQFNLKKSGFFPLGPVTTGKQAVAQARELNPDLVLMDINLLDGQTGISAAREILTRLDIPVIFLSGVADEEVLLAMRGSNPYAYLVKPVQQRELQAAIELALYKHGMERRLRESEARYRGLFETMTSGFALLEALPGPDGQVIDFRLVDINLALRNLMGVTDQDLQGKKLSEIDASLNMAFYINLYAQIHAGTGPVSSEIYEAVNDRYLELRAYSPGPGQMALVINDVTQRNKSDQAIAESELRFRQMAETVSEVFWLRSRNDDRILYANPAYERVWGRPVKELIESPQSFLDNVHPDDLARVMKAQKDMHQNGTLFDEEFRIICPDGSQRWVWSRTYPVREGDGQVVRYSGIAEDITERKQVEQKLLKSYRQTEQALLRMTVLRSIDTAITTHTDLPTMMQTVLDMILSLEEVDAGLIFYPENGGVSLAGVSGIRRETLSPVIIDILTRQANEVFRNGAACTQGALVESGVQPCLAALSNILASQMGFGAFAFMPLTTKGQMKGVLLLLSRYTENHREMNTFDFYQALALQAAIAIDNVELFQGYRRSNAELSRAYDETIRGWAEALELRSADTRGHCDRVVHLSERLARAMGMSEEELVHFRRGVMLHDIGKLGIPDSILLKNSSLTEEEWKAIHKHPVYGYLMLRNIAYLRPAVDVPYCHHERWDGTGYPRGLAGNNIPREARIFAVVDAWDALINERPYHPPWPPQDAIDYLIQQSGKQFDPEVVEVFLSLITNEEID